MLRCKCGGSLEIQSQSYPDEGMAFESYKCVSCGRTGSFRFGKGREEMSGCVTSVNDGW